MLEITEIQVRISAIIINVIIILLEIYVIKNLKRKKDIFKYYTYLQNLLLLVSSIMYLILININPNIAIGLRYVATTGSLTAGVVYIFLLSGNEKNRISKKDVSKNTNPKLINFLVHGLCPVLAFLNLVIFETIPNYNVSDIWTAITPLPSAIYMICFLYLSVTNKWKQPYDFKGKNKYLDLLTMILIPIIFIFISYFLWQLV